MKFTNLNLTNYQLLSAVSCKSMLSRASKKTSRNRTESLLIKSEERTKRKKLKHNSPQANRTSSSPPHNNSLKLKPSPSLSFVQNSSLELSKSSFEPDFEPNLVWRQALYQRNIFQFCNENKVTKVFSNLYSSNALLLQGVPTSWGQPP